MQNLSPKTADPAQISAMQAQLTARNQLKGGSNWFWWIAALSIINSLIWLAGGKLNFVIGLGMTQIVDGVAEGIGRSIAPDISGIVKAIGLLIDVGIAGLFVLFGFLAKKGYRWSFVVGMIIYALDGLIFVAVRSWLSVGFHLFALAGLYGGYKALAKLKQAEQSGAFPYVAEVPQYAQSPFTPAAQRNPHYWRNLGLLAGVLFIPVIVLVAVILFVP